MGLNRSKSCYINWVCAPRPVSSLNSTATLFMPLASDLVHFPSMFVLIKVKGEKILALTEDLISNIWLSKKL